MFFKTFRAPAEAARALPAIICIAISGIAAAQSSPVTPVGLWLNIDDKTGQAKAEIRITADSSGALTGVIEKALLPGLEPICTECTDDRQGKPKLGMEIIRGARQLEGKEVWEGGKILDPDNGKNYSLRLSPIAGGSKLEVRGSFGPLSRTQTWIRLQ